MGEFMEKRIMEKIDNTVNEILKGINYDGSSMIDTNAVLKYVSENKKIKIKFSRRNFNNISSQRENLSKIGAYTLFVNDNNNKSCIIVLNSAHNVVYQRFSLAHEIGHLCLDDFPKDGVTLSTHIDYRLFSIGEDTIKENKNLMKEQAANIFALKLLIPEKILYEKAKKMQSIRDIAEFFGVEKSALNSRIELLKI